MEEGVRHSMREEWTSLRYKAYCRANYHRLVEKMLTCEFVTNPAAPLPIRDAVLFCLLQNIGTRIMSQGLNLLHIFVIFCSDADLMPESVTQPEAFGIGSENLCLGYLVTLLDLKNVHSSTIFRSPLYRNLKIP